MRFTEAGRKARIPCVRPGCPGPAYLRVRTDYPNEWWCYCDACSLATTNVFDRKVEAQGMPSAPMALATWFGEGGDWVWVFEERAA